VRSAEQVGDDGSTRLRTPGAGDLSDDSIYRVSSKTCRQQCWRIGAGREV
jgi:hypothetical protein